MKKFENLTQIATAYNECEPENLRQLERDIAASGFTSDMHEQWGVCHNEEGRVVLNDDGLAVVITAKEQQRKKYCVIHRVDQNSSCPAAHLLGYDHIYKCGNKGLIRVWGDTLEEANKYLFDVAQKSVAEDDDAPAALSTRHWGLFAANAKRLDTAYTAYTDEEGCRHFHDNDVDGYDVAELIFDEFGRPDYHESI